MIPQGYEFRYFFHLKEGSKKPAETSGSLYLTLCGRWVYDSIVSDSDCPDRWVTCPSCAQKNPFPRFQSEVPASLMRRSQVNSRPVTSAEGRTLRAPACAKEKEELCDA